MTREMQRELKRQSMLRDNDHQLAKVVSVLSYFRGCCHPGGFLVNWSGEIPVDLSLQPGSVEVVPAGSSIQVFQPAADVFAVLEEAIGELIARRRVLTAAEEV